MCQDVKRAILVRMEEWVTIVEAVGDAAKRVVANESLCASHKQNIVEGFAQVGIMASQSNLRTIIATVSYTAEGLVDGSIWREIGALQWRIHDALVGTPFESRPPDIPRPEDAPEEFDWEGVLGHSLGD
jgi:hypothetical protein